MRQGKYYERLFVRVPREIEQQLFVLARKTGRPKSELIRAAIERLLDQELNQDRSDRGSDQGTLEKGIS